jgi:hypothetical protein
MLGGAATGWPFLKKSVFQFDTGMAFFEKCWYI